MATATQRRARRKVTQARQGVRAARRRQASRKALYDPSVPLTGKALRGAAQQVTDLQFKPKLAALDQQAKTETQQGTRLVERNASYYKDMASQEADRVARQQALGANLTTSLKGIADATAGQIDKGVADAKAAAAKDAELRGPGLAGGGDQRVIDELAAQRARAAATGQANQSAGAEATASYGGLANSLGGARALHGDEVHGDLVTRLATKLSAIGAERKATKASKGDAFTKNLLDLRQSGFENQATVAGLGIKRADLSATAARDQAAVDLAQKRLKSTNAHNRALERNTVRGQNVTKRGQDITAGQRAADRQARKDAAANKKPKTKEPQSSVNTRSAIVTVQGEYAQLLRQFGGDHARVAQTIRNRATAQKKVLPDYILFAAADLENFGYVTPGHVTALRNAGVRVPASWTHQKRHPQTSVTNNTHGG